MNSKGSAVMQGQVLNVCKPFSVLCALGTELCDGVGGLCKLAW